MVSRRRALTGVGGAGVVAALSAVGFEATPPGVSATAAAGAPTTTEDFTYRGHKIKITTSDEMIMAVVDGKHSVHVAKDSMKRLHSHLLPFSDYTNARKMLSDVIDMHERRLLVL
jgi:uncharacterized cupredoxin-like copper-binding protein